MRFKVRVLPGNFETLTVPVPEKKKIVKVLTNLIMFLRRGSSKPLIPLIPTPLSQHYSIIFSWNFKRKRTCIWNNTRSTTSTPSTRSSTTTIVQLKALVLVLSPILFNYLRVWDFKQKGLERVTGACNSSLVMLQQPLNDLKSFFRNSLWKPAFEGTS